MDPDTEIALIERVMEGVEIVNCTVCGDDGKVGTELTRIACPRCRGTKLTTRRTDAQRSA